MISANFSVSKVTLFVERCFRQAKQNLPEKLLSVQSGLSINHLFHDAALTSIFVLQKKPTVTNASTTVHYLSMASIVTESEKKHICNGSAGCERD